MYNYVKLSEGLQDKTKNVLICLPTLLSRSKFWIILLKWRILLQYCYEGK